MDEAKKRRASKAKKLEARAMTVRNGKKHLSSPSTPLFDIKGSGSKCRSDDGSGTNSVGPFSPGPFRLAYSTHFSPSRTMKKGGISKPKTRGKAKKSRSKKSVSKTIKSPTPKKCGMTRLIERRIELEEWITNNALSPESAERMREIDQQNPYNSPINAGPEMLGGSPLFSPENPETPPPVTTAMLYELGWLPVPDKSFDFSYLR